MDKESEKKLFWFLMIGFGAFAAFQIAREINFTYALGKR